MAEIVKLPDWTAKFSVVTCKQCGGQHFVIVCDENGYVFLCLTEGCDNAIADHKLGCTIEP